jgi:hypothetical protein
MNIFLIILAVYILLTPIAVLHLAWFKYHDMHWSEDEIKSDIESHIWFLLLLWPIPYAVYVGKAAYESSSRLLADTFHRLFRKIEPLKKRVNDSDKLC